MAEEEKLASIEITEVKENEEQLLGEPGLAAKPGDSFDGIELNDDYEVLELIGRGGMGQVYRVHDKKHDQIIAVKLLHKELIVDNQTVKRFQNEAAAAAGLTHANVVSVYGHGEAKDGSPYITMNYIEGESLSAILKRERELELQRGLSLFIQICDGLEYAHSQKLIHRDLKPSNIIISENPEGQRARIVDFGIAKVITTRGDTLNTLTASGEFLGTPMYMSPEQCLGQNIDHRTDVYAIGCMLFEALSGKGPYAGASSVEIIAKKMSEESPSLQNAKIPPALSIIVSCCMARNPKDRYNSVKELKEDLEAVFENKEPKHAKLKLGMDKDMVGSRILAAFIDLFIVNSISGICNVAGWVLMIGVAAVLGSGTGLNDWVPTIGLIFMYFGLPCLVMLSYFTLLETKRGTTFGKQICGLKVCDVHGNKLSWKQAFLRNLGKCVVVLILPFSGVVGFTLPEHALGVLTTIATIIIAIAICVSSMLNEHSMPWDRWVDAHIRRR